MNPQTPRCRGFAAAVLLAVTLVMAGSVRVAPARAEGGSPAGGPPQMSEAEMQKMMALMQPGPNHEALGRLVGKWKTTFRMWMGSGEPQVSEGTATYEWMLGERYLVNHQTGTFSDMPFEGMGIDGYDNGKREFFTCWMDNMGTGVMWLTGSADADGQGWTFRGSMFDPSQGKDVPVHTEVRLDGKDRYTYRMFEPMPGPDGKPQEMKIMEITAVRVP
jgi:hypothetical protein